MLYSFIKFVFNYVQYLFQKKYDKTRYTQRSPISLFPRYIIPFLYIFISFWLSCHCFFFLIICKSLNPHHLSLRVVIYINLSLAYFHLLYTRGQSRAVYRNSSFFFFFLQLHNYPCPLLMNIGFFQSSAFTGSAANNIFSS